MSQRERSYLLNDELLMENSDTFAREHLHQLMRLEQGNALSE